MILRNLYNSADRASEFLKLVSGRSRLLLLNELLEGELSVRQLTAAVNGKETGVSQQLAILRVAGLVSTRQEGQLRIYSLSNLAAQQLTQSALELSRERATKVELT